jgi:hypothetical protein
VNSYPQCNPPHYSCNIVAKDDSHHSSILGYLGSSSSLSSQPKLTLQQTYSSQISQQVWTMHNGPLYGECLPDKSHNVLPSHCYYTFVIMTNDGYHVTMFLHISQSSTFVFPKIFLTKHIRHYHDISLGHREIIP